MRMGFKTSLIFVESMTKVLLSHLAALEKNPMIFYKKKDFDKRAFILDSTTCFKSSAPPCLFFIQSTRKMFG